MIYIHNTLVTLAISYCTSLSFKMRRAIYLTVAIALVAIAIPLSKAAGRESRIVDGDETEPNEFPWQVALMFRNDPGIAVTVCGGTLISTSYVLTAAHCAALISDIVNVTIGAHNLTDPTEPFQQTITVDNTLGDSITLHEDWQRIGIQNDIAVIRFPDPITLEPGYVELAALPLDDGEWVDINDTAEVSGWGLTSTGGEVSDVLNSKVVTVIPVSTCEDFYNDVVINNYTLCTTYGTCSGDSGGPLNSYPRSGIVYGIVSFGPSTGCEDTTMPTGFTRVRYYLDWIYNNTDLIAPSSTAT